MRAMWVFLAALVMVGCVGCATGAASESDSPVLVTATVTDVPSEQLAIMEVTDWDYEVDFSDHLTPMDIGLADVRAFAHVLGGAENAGFVVHHYAIQAPDGSLFDVRGDDVVPSQGEMKVFIRSLLGHND